MNPFMSCQRRVFHEGLITEVTFEQSLFLVSPLVSRHQTLFGRRIRTSGIYAAFQNISPMYAHVRCQMIFVLGGKIATWTLQTLDALVDQLMGRHAAFVRKLLVALVTMEHFARVQDLMELHAMDGARCEVATFSGAMEHGLLRVNIAVI